MRRAFKRPTGTGVNPRARPDVAGKTAATRLPTEVSTEAVGLKILASGHGRLFAHEHPRAASIRAALVRAVGTLKDGHQDQQQSLHGSSSLSTELESARLYVSRAELGIVLCMIGLPIAGPTLATMASRGGGPKYARFLGHVAYAIDDVCIWLEQLLSRPLGSTSDRSVQSDELRRHDAATRNTIHDAPDSKLPLSPSSRRGASS